MPITLFTPKAAARPRHCLFTGASPSPARRGGSYIACQSSLQASTQRGTKSCGLPSVHRRCPGRRTAPWPPAALLPLPSPARSSSSPPRAAQVDVLHRAMLCAKNAAPVPCAACNTTSVPAFLRRRHGDFDQEPGPITDPALRCSARCGWEAAAPAPSPVDLSSRLASDRPSDAKQGHPSDVSHGWLNPARCVARASEPSAGETASHSIGSPGNWPAPKAA